jgi:hypothetical protein
MRAFVGLLISAALGSSAAFAEPPASTDASPTVAKTPAPASAPTVSGIVVKPLPKKSCSSRDKECVALVVAELKQNYPEQLKAFCFQWQTQAVRSQWVNDQLYESLGSNFPPPTTAFGVNPAVSQACAVDRPAAK